jgi:hypothetical protein
MDHQTFIVFVGAIGAISGIVNIILAKTWDARAAWLSSTCFALAWAFKS